MCQNGITGLGVSNEAWIEVAEDNKRTNVGLNIAMVKYLIDRQSNAIAQAVFSEKVEDGMKRKGWFREAEFCQRIREWYKAEDEAEISAIDRHTARMEMRKLLLSPANLAKFPPPGSSVGRMTIVMFEGILTNIDRRTQLYALVPGETYNVRAPTSLDAENLFSEFQELDSRSSGTLMADDIPAALRTASYIMRWGSIQTGNSGVVTILARFCFYIWSTFIFHNKRLLSNDHNLNLHIEYYIMPTMALERLIDIQIMLCMDQ